MLHHCRQRHGKRCGDVRDRQHLLPGQPIQDRPPRRIGEGREGAIEPNVLIVNHVVKYRAAVSLSREGNGLHAQLKILLASCALTPSIQPRRAPRVPNRRKKSAGRNVPPGLAARTLAVHLVAGVLMDRQPLEQALAECSARPQVAGMETRDRALARAVAATVLRRQGELERVLNAFLERPTRAGFGRSCSPQPHNSCAWAYLRTPWSIWRWRRHVAIAAPIASPGSPMRCCGA
jgi:hypothetical protein